MKNLTRALTVVMAIMIAAPAFATNGYFSLGYGTKNKGMGGVGLAMPISLLNSASNPATAVFVGEAREVGIAFFNPNRDYTVTGMPTQVPDDTPMNQRPFSLTPGLVESDSKMFYMPSIAFNWMIDDMSSIGVAIYGNGGMNTTYNTSDIAGGGGTFHGSTATTGVNLMQIFTGVTYSRKLNENHSVGVSAVLALQLFEANGLEMFGTMSSASGSLTDNGLDKSFGGGLKVGYMGNLTPKFSLGLAYQSKMFMSEFDDYAGLYAEAGDFDIPASISGGVAFKATEKLTIASDVQFIQYSGVKSVSNPMASLFTGTALGAENGAGFGWEDMTVYKIGFDFAAREDLSFRAGYSFTEQPIQSSEMMFNILAPGVVEQHLTFGVTKAMAGRDYSLSLMKAFSNDVEGPNMMDGAQMINLRMDQWELEFGISF